MKSQTVRQFWEQYSLLPQETKELARKAYTLFAADHAHPSLHFHRLEGHPNVWSVRVSRDVRAVGLLNGDTITWFWIGDHKSFERAFG